MFTSPIRPSEPRQTRPLPTAGVVFSAMILSVLSAGCALSPRSESPESRARIQALEAQGALLRQQNETGKKEVARLQLQILEGNARIHDLEAALRKRDQEIEEMRERLKRMDTRTQALTGPAQAAAAIAEAEAALQVATSRNEIDPTGDAALEIRALLQEGTTAYESGDYARAAALGDLVTRKLSEGVAQTAPAEPPSAALPEEPLASPVAFRVRVDSKVRGGPGMDFAPRTYLKAGSEVTGLATRGQWVKILTQEQTPGWIFRKLLTVPE
jgi:hypothetical protein